MTVDIRPVATTDREAWAALFRGYRDFYALTPDEAVVDTVWGWLTDDAHELQGLVAEIDGAPVAIAHWRLFARPSRGGTAIFLDDLFTTPSARGEGVGRALIASLQSLAAAEGLLEVRWITSETNVDAQRLYDRVADRLPFLTYSAPPR
ncbi:GNAT family N-acetyltransferase [Microbacterium marinilacus]|uniref:GNAT family N-acetyltransferase n=1 Tax=Microbacterium marinilacus TaxID=415209 RepID=UPI0027DFDA8D|nr:GNAT family N-acetyltransferase [Microbacterium marinilacus]